MAAESGTVEISIPDELRFMLPVRQRTGVVRVPVDGVNSLLHVIESLGVSRTEFGRLEVNGREVSSDHRPTPGEQVVVHARTRPQPVPAHRYLLDVHLGTLARRMRTLGLDTSYSNDADDPELVEQAIAENRVLLTRDRGLLRRKALPDGAFVRGQDPDAQLADILDRFRPPLAPWTRCPSCNGLLQGVPVEKVEHLIEPGTRRSYSEFFQCNDCGRPYWHGAHAEGLEQIVASVQAD
ncbi:Mut7-C ubiquitin/RNAse domain-containing protein [Kineosporia rhizophila]|uniref:Mut7-C ubiquitin/RNAse domain-containing protein n=1 Tax=Kineosporia rhizophila TaxID=84633 RepID=UPI001E2C48FE|nr:Mut7-C ubiquitin/RNAse domain-containing protein [Kineosporia rhizophila]MCE0537597.1 Mut7-C ubiquitin/RNAse domain-containing protein [Kineosporia rhizophila]